MPRKVKSLRHNKVGISPHHRDHQPVKSRERYNRPRAKEKRRKYKDRIQQLKFNDLKNEDY